MRYVLMAYCKILFRHSNRLITVEAKRVYSLLSDFILVARYLRASLIVTNIHVGGQPADQRGGGGGGGVNGVGTPRPLAICHPPLNERGPGIR
jgi:hypothetical protein